MIMLFTKKMPPNSRLKSQVWAASYQPSGLSYILVPHQINLYTYNDDSNPP